MRNAPAQSGVYFGASTSAERETASAGKALEGAPEATQRLGRLGAHVSYYTLTTIGPAAKNPLRGEMAPVWLAPHNT